VATERDRERVREAAELLLEAGEHRTAGEAYASIGDDAGAARAYRQGGLVDLMEEALSREDDRGEREREVRQSFADYELHLRGGARELAVEALRRCVAAAASGDNAAEYRRLLDELESRRVAGGRVTLHVRRGDRITVTGLSRVSIGRDPLCDLPLRSAGVSRRHAEIEVAAAEGRPGLDFALRDAGSRNGTRLGGLPIGGVVPLRGAGSFALNDDCVVDFDAGDDLLVLRIDRGLDRGQIALCAVEGRAIDLARAGLETSLRFERGRPILVHPPGQLTLNGDLLMNGDVQLLHGDQLAFGGHELEVV
jgi:hypothetical protein